MSVGLKRECSSQALFILFDPVSKPHFKIFIFQRIISTLFKENVQIKWIVNLEQFKRLLFQQKTFLGF